MRLLLDTNIMLEVLLNQRRADEARAPLAAVEAHQFFMSDFALHSIGLALFRHRRYSAFKVFLQDMVRRAGVALLSCSTSDMDALAAQAEAHQLDFDDAYQYHLAERDDLVLVSFDSDFDRTPRGRRTPAELVNLTSQKAT